MYSFFSKLAFREHISEDSFSKLPDEIVIRILVDSVLLDVKNYVNTTYNIASEEAPVDIAISTSVLPTYFLKNLRLVCKRFKVLSINAQTSLANFVEESANGTEEVKKVIKAYKAIVMVNKMLNIKALNDNNCKVCYVDVTSDSMFRPMRVIFDRVRQDMLETAHVAPRVLEWISPQNPRPFMGADTMALFGMVGDKLMVEWRQYKQALFSPPKYNLVCVTKALEGPYHCFSGVKLEGGNGPYVSTGMFIDDFNEVPNFQRLSHIPAAQIERPRGEDLPPGGQELFRGPQAIGMLWYL